MTQQLEYLDHVVQRHAAQIEESISSVLAYEQSAKKRVELTEHVRRIMRQCESDVVQNCLARYGATLQQVSELQEKKWRLECALDRWKLAAAYGAAALAAGIVLLMSYSERAIPTAITAEQGYAIPSMLRIRTEDKKAVLVYNSKKYYLRLEKNEPRIMPYEAEK